MSTPALGSVVIFCTGVSGDPTQRAAIVAVTSAQDETLTGDDAVVYVLDPQCARFERAAYSETPAAGCWTERP